MNEISKQVKSEAKHIEGLMLRHGSAILGYILTQTADYNRAEDIYQDVCGVVCEKFDQFKEGTNFKAWVIKIARNEILNWYQKQSKERRIVQLNREIAERIADEAFSRREDGTLDEELEALGKCLDDLKGKSRLIVLERYGQGLSCRAIAEKIAWTLQSVYVALSRVRKSLEKCIRARISQTRLTEGL